MAPSTDPPKPFDIVQTYNNLLSSDPDITMPVAAIESLVLLLTHSPASTISETLELLASSTAHLKASIPNPISLSAGTDLFQRYLITQLQRPGQLGPAGDFKSIRAHLLSNGRLFAARAKESRDKIAAFGRGFVRDGTTVLTNGGSRVVSALLQKAADDRGSTSAVRFKVIYVLPRADSKGKRAESEGISTVRALRARGVPVATIPESAVAYSLGKVDMVIVGAEGVVENGGVISRMGTYQIGVLAKSMGKPFYVVAESHKFVRLYPLSQYDLGVEQDVIKFTTENESSNADEAEQLVATPTALPSRMANQAKLGDQGKGQQVSEATITDLADTTPLVRERSEYFGNSAFNSQDSSMNTKADAPVNQEGNRIAQTVDDAVDFTPPNLISALITESGVLTPSAVSEELIKIWF